MSNRTLRVNELVRRELNDILRRHYRTEAVVITITEVRVSPDLREGRVFVAVAAGEEDAKRSLRWLRSRAVAIRMELGRRIVLKYLPRLTYVLDHSVERGARILQVLDGIERPSASERPVKP